MNPSSPLTLLLAPLATALALTSAANAAAKIKDPYADGEVLVRLHTTAGLGGLLARHQLALAGQSGARPIYRLRIADGASVPDKLAALALDTEVIAAEANVQPRSPEARKNVVWAIGTEVEYRAQWAPTALHLAEAHALATGAGVRVAVLDTGADLAHPALAGRLLPGRDFVDGDTDPSEDGTRDNAGYGHGTHVAGLVALAAPGAQIMPIRVLDEDGRGDVWRLADALAWALDPDGQPATDDGAHVINMSLGTLDRTRIVDALMTVGACVIPKPNAKPDTDYTDPGYDADKARCAARGGAVITASAGNSGSPRAKEYPAAEGNYGLLPVAASAQDQRLAGFSNHGSWIEVAAPGDFITSSVPGGGYGTWSGTSMSAPLAAGVAALVRQKAPALSARDVARRLEDTGARLCGGTNIVQIDALAAVRNRRPQDLCD
jgi:subtilisin family serine protease